MHDMDSSESSYEHRRNVPSIRYRQRYSLSQLVLVGCLGFLLCYLLEAVLSARYVDRSVPVLLSAGNQMTTKSLVRPENVKIIGLVFYGRAQFTNILEWLFSLFIDRVKYWLTDLTVT